MKNYEFAYAGTVPAGVIGEEGFVALAAVFAALAAVWKASTYPAYAALIESEGGWRY